METTLRTKTKDENTSPFLERECTRIRIIEDSIGAGLKIVACWSSASSESNPFRDLASEADRLTGLCRGKLDAGHSDLFHHLGPGHVGVEGGFAHLGPGLEGGYGGGLLAFVPARFCNGNGGWMCEESSDHNDRADTAAIAKASPEYREADPDVPVEVELEQSVDASPMLWLHTDGS